MKRILIIIGAIVLLGLVIIFKPASKTKPKGPAGGPKTPTAVTYAIVRDTLFTRSIIATGSLAPHDMVRIAPEIAGRIISVSFTEGAKVSQGQILARLDDSELQAQLTKLKALLALAETNAKREQSLLQGGGTSKELFERAENTVTTLLADIAVVKAAIAKTIIKAPFAGTVGIKQLSRGSYVSPGSVITELVNTQPIRIEASIPERYGINLKKGMTIQFRQAGDSILHEAFIHAINPMIDNTTRTIGIVALHKNAQNMFKAGAFAEIILPMSKPEPTILISTEAAVPDIRGLRVFVLRNGKAIPQPITTGMRTNTSLEIVKGLSIGDSLIISGASLVKPNAPVLAKPHRN
ncbi:MAG: efflux RND transporter periplasmic adaptor subunit [bacterium]